MRLPTILHPRCIDSILGRTSLKLNARHNKRLPVVSERWIEVANGEYVWSPENSTMLLLDSLKCLQSMSPEDVFLTAGIFEKRFLVNMSIEWDRELTDFFGQSLLRTQEAYLRHLSLGDLLKLYRSLLSHSIAAPEFKDLPHRVLTGIKSRLESADVRQLKFPISELLDALGEDLDDGILDKLCSIAFDRCKTTRWADPLSERSVKIAKDLVAIQQYYERTKRKPHSDLIKAVREFILS